MIYMKPQLKIKHLYALLWVLGWGFSLHAQSYTEDRLTTLYIQIYNHRHDYELKTQLLETFRTTLVSTLASTPISKLNLKSINKHITQVSAPDGKLTIISWNTFSGGSWHSYNAAYQYVNDSGHLEAHSIGKSPKAQDDLMYADAYYLKIHHIEAKTYLVKGYGTHGFGHDFYTFRLFNFNLKTAPKDCKNGFDGTRIFCFEKPRAIHLKPEYNTKEQRITCPELVPQILDGDATGYSTPNGSYQNLMYNNGKFTTL